MNELFDSDSDIKSLNPERNIRIFHGKDVFGYTLNIGAKEYLFYMEPRGRPGIYTFGFAILNSNTDGVALIHDLTGDGHKLAFKIYSTAIKVLKEFVLTHDFSEVQISGYVYRQFTLYVKLARHLKTQLPSNQFQIIYDKDGDEIIISKGNFYIKHEDDWGYSEDNYELIESSIV